MNNGLLNKFLTGTSGILDTVNKIIPLYQDIKPLIKNIVNIKNKVKDLNISNLFKNYKVNNIKTIENKKEEETSFSSSNPQFFL